MVNEENIAKFKSLRLTSKRILQESNKFWHGDTKEMLLSQINSMRYGYRRDKLLFCIGIVLLIFGLYVRQILGILVILVSIILIVAGLLRHEYIELRSVTLKLSENGRGAQKFADSVKDILNDKGYV
jgi:hypothetical protein